MEGIVDANPDEAETLYALREGYRVASKPQLARAALHQAVHNQVDKHKKTCWEEQLNSVDS